MKTAILLLLIGAIPTLSQQPSITTNVVTAHPAFRIVNGQLYNTELSTNFATITGQCVAVLTNGVVVQRMEIQQTYQETPTNAAQLTVAIATPSAQLVKEELVPGKKFFIRNHPDQPLPAVGSPIHVRAMRDGVFTYESEIMELWDCGIPSRVLVLHTNAIPTNPLKAGTTKP